MPTVTLAPITKQQFFDASGDPLAGGLVYTFEAGTSTPLATYADSTGSTPNTNPITLDVAGRASIWLSMAQPYKIEVRNASGVVQYVTDNVDPSIYADGSVDTAALADGSVTASKIASSNTEAEEISGVVKMLASGTGAVHRSLREWGRDRGVTVKDFGAVGDGVADDTNAIQAALAAADRVFFPAGVYRVTDTLLYKTGNFIFGESSKSAIRLDSVSGKNMLFPNMTLGTIASPSSSSIDDVVIRDITIDQQVTDDADFVEAAMTIVALSPRRMVIDNVHFMNPSGDAVYISRKYGGQASSVQPYDVQINNCRFTGANVNRQAISVITGENIRIIGNHFYKMTRANMPCAIDLEPDNAVDELISNVVVANNTFDTCKAAFATYITGTTGSATITNIVFANNTIRNPWVVPSYTAESIADVAIFNASNVIVEGNTFENSQDLSIMLSNASDVLVTGNSISTPKLGGVLAKDVFNVKVDNNNILIATDTYNATANYGIRADTNGFVLANNNSFVGGSISNNRIRNTAGTVSQSVGIQLEGNVKDTYISGTVEGFALGLYLGFRSEAIPQNLTADLDLTQNTTGATLVNGGETPQHNKWSLGRGISFGRASFAAAATITISGLPVTTTSYVRVTRVGSTGLGNALTASCATDGTLTITSSAAESGSVVWEIVSP